MTAPTRLVACSTDTGRFAVYERAPGLSNNVRRLAAPVQVDEWDKVRSGKTYVTHEMIDALRRDPTMYEPATEPEGPRAA